MDKDKEIGKRQTLAVLNMLIYSIFSIFTRSKQWGNYS